MATWKNRIIGHGEESPDQLAANPRNWRIHPASQQAALKGALEEIGWIQEVIVNQRTGYVVDGHARVALAMRHNQQSIPVKYIDLTDEEEGLALATFDPISALAVQDTKQLESLVRDITTEDEDLQQLLSEILGEEITMDMGFLDEALAAGDGKSPWPGPEHDLDPMDQTSMLFRVTPEQRTLIMKVVNLAKKEDESLESTADAIVAICEDYQCRHES